MKIPKIWYIIHWRPMISTSVTFRRSTVEIPMSKELIWIVFRMIMQIVLQMQGSDIGSGRSSGEFPMTHRFVHGVAIFNTVNWDAFGMVTVVVGQWKASLLIKYILIESFPLLKSETVYFIYDIIHGSWKRMNSKICYLVISHFIHVVLSLSDAPAVGSNP